MLQSGHRDQRGLGPKKEVIMGYGWNINTLNQGNERKIEVHSILKIVKNACFRKKTTFSISLSDL